MAIAIGDITSQASATSDFVLGATAAGQARRFPLNTLAASYLGTGTGAVTRTYKAKIEEIERSIIDFGGDPTGTSDCTTAFNNAKAAGVTRLRFPAGTYRFNSTILVDKYMHLVGDGREKTFLYSYVSGANHGMRIIGDSALTNGVRSNLITLEGFTLRYQGSGLTTPSGAGSNNWSGIYIQRKVMMNDVYVRGWTNDGIYFSTADADESTASNGTIGEAVFFSELRNVWSKDNGRDGIRVRMGANVNVFINCQFDRNDGVGFHHLTDGGATYGNVIVGGQCSYNASYGYYFESGTNIRAYGLYSELNGSPSHTTADDYTTTPYDIYVGDNCSRSYIDCGVVYNNDNTHVRAPNRGLNDSCMVVVGGMRIFTSTAYHIPARTSTGIANLAGGATLTDVINKVNEIISALETSGVTPTV